MQIAYIDMNGVMHILINRACEGFVAVRQEKLKTC